LLIFDEVTDKTMLAPFFMAHGVDCLQQSVRPSVSGVWWVKTGGIWQPALCYVTIILSNAASARCHNTNVAV